MSVFSDYITSENKSDNLRLALTDSSYRNVKNDHTMLVNSDLATLGDAVLKLLQTEILYDDKVKEISNERQKYESDWVLVNKVARHYDLLRYLHFDEKDQEIKKDYNHSGKRKDSHKYIATAMEAVLGAYYLDNGRDKERVKPVVEEWMRICRE